MTQGAYKASTGLVHKKAQRLRLTPVVCLNHYTETPGQVRRNFGQYHLQGMVYYFQLVRNHWVQRRTGFPGAVGRARVRRLGRPDLPQPNVTFLCQIGLRTLRWRAHGRPDRNGREQ